MLFNRKILSSFKKNKFFTLIFVALTFFNIVYINKNYRFLKKINKKIDYISGKKEYDSISLRFLDFASSLQPFVISTKTIYPVKDSSDFFYNASIIDNDKGGYFLFYRHDILLPHHVLKTSIDVVELDENFEISGVPVSLTKGLKNPEDPRVFKNGNKICCVFNDLIESNNKKNKRGMFFADFDSTLFEFTNIKRMNYTHNEIEKNWSPFSDLSNEDLYKYIYEIVPPEFININKKEDKVYFQKPNYESYRVLNEKWVPFFGRPRGGAPVISINDKEYLNLFHSSIKDELTGIYWYFMGAYTFEKNFPYNLTSYTALPVFFSGAYSSPMKNPIAKNKRVLYPAGVVKGIKDGRQVLHISCGENDAAIKIVTIDLEDLINWMKSDADKTSVDL